MTRIPPNLLYLTIYNPTLLPDAPVPDDDEDAEEQAHIVFYTSKERAVSRDKMLRQVGLAKALVNFSEIFTAEESCRHVHSQSRRMIMVSPEPDFWIHACVELAKVTRGSADKGKSKLKDKGKKPDKGKESVVQEGSAYDYINGSVHDISLRADLIQGYERFKLTHGTFTSILERSGHQALELQLERFFTVWAWSWNLEEGSEFGEHLGLPLHPASHLLTPLLDEYLTHLHDGTSAVVVSPPYIVPSTRYRAGKYPRALFHHLSTLVPSPLDPTQTQPEEQANASGKAPTPPNDSDPAQSSKGANEAGASMFLPIPNVNVNMDVRKWNWQGYLTFGRHSSKKSEDRSLPKGTVTPPHQPVDETGKLPNVRPLENEVDKNALDDAMSSDSISISSRRAGTIASKHGQDSQRNSPSSRSFVDQPAEASGGSPYAMIPADSNDALLSRPFTPEDGPPEEVVNPVPQFMASSVYLKDPENAEALKRRPVFCLVSKYNPMLLALVGVDVLDSATQSEELKIAGERALTLFQDIKAQIDVDALKQVPDILPNATNILQQTDTHIIGAGGYTTSTLGFTSKSNRLYEAKAIQELEPDISEVFSRGQNPQHWHIARNGLRVVAEDDSQRGEVFMEIFRKETSLTDVDNVLMGVVRKCGLVEAS